MIRLLPIIALALTACAQTESKDNAVAAEIVRDTTRPEDCAVPQIVSLRQETPIDNKTLEETKARFAAAFGRACVNGLLESKEFLDPKADEQGRLFLLNAPDANVASIYLSEAAGNRMVLEYPFRTPDGKTKVPSPAELDEAIYCTMVGATANEQEESGRCLAD